MNPGAAYEHVLMFLCNMDDEGIVILPTHRGVHSLPDFSGAGLAKVRAHLPVETRDGSPEDAMRAVAAAGRDGKAIGWSTGDNRFHLVTFPDLRAFCDRRLPEFPPQLRTLDVVLLHGYLIEQTVGDLFRGRDGGAVRQVLQGPLEGDRGSRLRGDPGRLLPEPPCRSPSSATFPSRHVLPQKSTSSTRRSGRDCRSSLDLVAEMTAYPLARRSSIRIFPPRASPRHKPQMGVYS